MLYNLSEAFSLNILLTVVLSLLIDIFIIRNIFILLFSILKHFWGCCMRYFISSNSIPSQSKSADIVGKIFENKEITEQDLAEVKTVKEE
jgi:hypothetical protein